MVKKMMAKIERNGVGLSEQLSSRAKSGSLTEVADTIVNKVYENKKYENPSDRIFKIEFSVKSVLFAIVAVLIFLFWQKLMPVIMVFFFAFVMASGFKPIIDWLQTKRISKAWAIAISYFTFFILIAIVMGIVVVPFLNEFDAMVRSIPQISDKLASFVDSISGAKIPFVTIDSAQFKSITQESLKSFTSNILPVLSNSFDGIRVAINTIADVAGGLITVVTSIMISIYLLNDHDYLVGSLLNKFVDYKKHKMVWKLLTDVEGKLGSWVVGQFVLSVVIGMMSWIALTILKVPFAIPLAVLAGALESIPNLGPIISAIPAILIALIDGGPNSAVYTGLAYVIIQQLEGALIVPKIMGNAVGMKAIYVLAAVMIGFALGNFIGALVAIPILVILKIGLEFYFDLQRMKAIDKI